MIRKAEYKDIDALNELGRLINKNFSNLFKMSEIMEEEYSKIFVYEENNLILAFLHITELYEIVDIINIVVKPEERKKGIASLLLDYMIGDANPLVELITLEVSVDNKEALLLYKKFGFEIFNKRKSYYDKKDAYVMGRKLKE